MKFETITKRLVKGNRIKIYIANTIYPSGLFYVGYVSKAYHVVKPDHDGQKRVDLDPHVCLNLNKGGDGLSGMNSDDRSQIIGTVVEGSRIYVTNSFRMHRKQTRKIVKEVCHRYPNYFKKYLDLAKNL